MDVYQYREEFSELLRDISAHLGRSQVPFGRAINEAALYVRNIQRPGVATDSNRQKMMFVGNGGSAAIAIHQSTDFMKQCAISTYAPADVSLVTCMANDYGYENVFAEPIGRVAHAGDLLVAISSSGKSPNILNAVKAARAHSCDVITLSGFDSDNPLRSMGDVNFYVPVRDYRYVESAHLFICNSILETVLGKISE